MGTSGFEQAAERWLTLMASGSEEDCAEFLALEEEIINHEPATTAEVVTMLKVLAVSLEGDLRADGADVDALRRIALAVCSPRFNWRVAA